MLVEPVDTGRQLPFRVLDKQGPVGIFGRTCIPGNGAQISGS